MKFPLARALMTIAALLASSAVLAQAAARPDPNDPVKPWLGLWQGQIGQQRIVMALSVDPARQRVEGRYFYERHGRDLSLWGPALGQPVAQALEMKECPADYGSALEICDQPTATLTLRLPTDQGGKMEGFWQGHGLPGRRPPPGSPLSLTKISGYIPSAEAFKDPYEQRRLKGLQARLGDGGQFGPVAWQTLRDARSNVAVPQFNKGADPKVLQAINQQLKQGWTERVTNALTAVDHDDELKVVFANRRWLATTYSLGAYHPGAAHPIIGFTADTYDLATGQRVDWARWFRFTAPASRMLDLNRQDLLAAQVLKALTAEVAAGFSEQGPQDPNCAQLVLDHYACKGGACANGELTGGRVPLDWQVWPLPGGLAVAPDIYSEADRHCRGNEIVLPWKQVRAALLRPQTLP